MEADATQIDLPAYLARIGYWGSATVDLASLQALHLAHATHIPFENVDVLMGLPIRLDAAGLMEKLVHGQRGGYCFEQNMLFSLALEQLGFPLTRLSARVRMRTERILPRTHMA